MDNMREYRTFYGISVSHYTIDFGILNDWHKLLVEEYISDGCLCAETSTATLDTNIFLYPNHIAKVYFIEGVISGHITLTTSGATAIVNSYRVTVGKMNEDGESEELYSTGWRTVLHTLPWDVTYEIGEEGVYPFWIDAWNKSELSEFDRIFVKVEIDGDNPLELYHSNDATWEDLKITIPIIT